MAEATRKEVEAEVATGLLRLKPPRIALALVISAIGLHFLFRNHLRVHFASPVCGVAAIILGFLLMIWAWWIFRRRDTAICPTATARVLVDRGPFRVTRNPMYAGMTAILTGCALWLGSLPALFAPLAFFALMNVVFIPFEERRLVEIFGRQYADYRSRVRRWL